MFFTARLIIKKMETKYDSGIAAYDTDIDFIWRMTRRAFGIKRNGKLYKI